MSLPLPSLDEPTSTVQVSSLPALQLEAVPSRGTNLAGLNAYMIHVKQANGRIAAVAVLVHPAFFKQARIDEMVAEAASVTNECCLGNRRKQLAAAKVGIADATELNERWFPTDVEFFEAVMMDKFQFQRLHTINASTVIESTVNMSPVKPAA